MADVKIQVTTFTAPASTGTKDVTIAGFGTPDAVMFIFGRGSTEDSLVANAALGYGFTDLGTTDVSLATGSLDNTGTTDTWRHWQSNKCITMRSGGGGSEDYAAAFSATATDGLTLNFTSVTGNEELITAIFFGGADLDLALGTADIQSAETSGVSVLGFEPDVVLQFTLGGGVGGSGTNGIASIGVSLNTSPVEDYSFAWVLGHGASAESPQQVIQNTTSMQQLFSGSISWTATVDTFDSDGFTLDTNVSGGDDMVYLALGFGGNSYSAGIYPTPTSTGVDSLTDPGFQPGFALVLASSSEFGIGSIEQDDDAGHIALIASDGTTTAGCGMVVDEAADPTNNASEAVGSFQVRDSAQAVENEADLDSFTANGIDFNFTTADATSRDWWYFVVEANDSGVSGTMAGTLPMPTASMAGNIEHTGTMAGTLPMPTASMAGAIEHTGTMAGTLPMPTASMAGAIEHTGTFAGTLPIPTASMAGAVTPAAGASGQAGGTIGWLPRPYIISEDYVELGPLVGVAVLLTQVTIEAQTCITMAAAGRIDATGAVAVQVAVSVNGRSTSRARVLPAAAVHVDHDAELAAVRAEQRAIAAAEMREMHEGELAALLARIELQRNTIDGLQDDIDVLTVLLGWDH